jgi:hypothetical protein
MMSMKKSQPVTATQQYFWLKANQAALVFWLRET